MEMDAVYDVDALWETYFHTGGEETKQKLIRHYLFLVGGVVRRLMPQYRDYSEKDELMSCGVIGLIDAVNKFDPAFGVKFQTYASVRIRGEIIDYMRRQDWAPTSLRKKISSVQQAYETLEASNGRRPTEREVADFLGMKERAVRKVLQQAHMFHLVRFEAMLFEKETGVGAEPAGQDPYQHIENEAVSEALRTLVEQLPERERLVITLHYYEGMPMKHIAAILKVSESRVSQIHSRVLMDMRRALED